MVQGAKKYRNHPYLVWKRSLLGLAALALGAGLLAGCEQSNDNASGTGAATGASGGQAAATQPINLSMLVNFVGEPPQPGNEVEQAIEKYTGAKLQIQWISDIKQKMPVLIASGDLPQVVSVTNSQLKLPYMVDALRGGVFWNLTPYIKDYPNLSKINPIMYQNTSLDGQIYGLPAVRPLARFAITYRKDWLDRLGMKEPQTLDDFYQIAKAFAEKDPDNNGKKDTYGLIEFKTLSSVDHIALWLGAPNDWGVVNGKFVYAPTTPEYLQALKFVKKLYDEKLMNQDFAVTEKTAWESAFVSGKAGLYMNITDGAFKLGEKMKKTVPEAKLDMFSMLPGLNGGRVNAENGTNGIFALSKSSVKTEADVKRILGVFDKLSDPQMATLFKWGIEGKTYKLENGKPVYTDSQLYNSLVSPYGKIMADDDHNAISGDLAPAQQKEEKLNADNAKKAVADPTEPLISITYSEKGGQLDKIIEDAKTKYVMGMIDDAGWQKAMTQWRQGGGDKIAEEYAAEYAKAQAATGKK
ncbi:MAG: transporter substrate-binding protein [Paenibacillaceae bacterium]|nr:transporter substrate-binding protein [Paenibacillaceae bacterium]